MAANDRQVGGAHYYSQFQHWDYAYKLELGYHVGNATKYIARAHMKNGVEDLKKALHYIDKAEELGLQGSPLPNDEITRINDEFMLVNNLSTMQAIALVLIVKAEWEGARQVVSEMINA